MREQLNATSILSVRVTPDERAILEIAAEQNHASLSEFIRRKAIEAAEGEIFNRPIVTIPAKDWEAFEKWMTAPPQILSGLKELSKRPLSWEKPQE